eukprot:168311-Rhodomonas_salina.7
MPYGAIRRCSTRLKTKGRFLRAPYAMSGTDVPYATARGRVGLVELRQVAPSYGPTHSLCSVCTGRCP